MMNYDCLAIPNIASASVS